MGKAVSTIKRTDVSTFTVEMPPIPVVTVTDARREWDKTTIVGTVADIRKGAKAIEDAFGKAGEPVMQAQSLTLFNVLDVSKAVGTKNGEPYANQQALAEAMGLKSKGYVTRLVRLGRATVHYGVKRGSKDYGLLAKCADAGLFSDVLDKTPVDVAEFRKVMVKAHEYAAKNGGVVPSTAAIKAIEAGKDETRKAQVPTGNSEPAETPKDEAPKAMTLGDILRVIHGLEGPIAALSDESAPKAWQALVNVAAGDKRKRETLAAAAKRNGKAPAKPAPKAPAKPSPATVKVAPKVDAPKAIEAPKSEAPKA